MNRGISCVGSRRQRLSTPVTQKRRPDTATNPLPILGKTPQSCRLRHQCQQLQADAGPVTRGFSRHERTKRMIAWHEKRPCPHTAYRARRLFFPPSPGYPLLGCTPAEPNSVSPGTIHLTSRFGRSSHGDKWEGMLRKTRRPKPCMSHQNRQNPITGSHGRTEVRGRQFCKICRPNI